MMDGSAAGSYDGTAASSFDYHHSMLEDRERTEAFLKAILSVVRPDDVVLDIGCGTGVLSLFAALAGARVVYAVEQEPVIHVAESIAAANGLSDRITFLEGSSRDLDLPEKADVLISETIGNVAFDEGILTWVSDAVDRLLVPDARIVPRTLRLVVALVEAPRTYAEMDRWTKPLMTFDFGPLWEVGVNNMHWVELSPVALLTEPLPIFTVDLAGGAPMELAAIDRLVAARNGTVHGIGAWFEANLADGISLSNAPPKAESWQQGLLPLASPIEVAAGQAVDLEVGVLRGGKEWRWRVGPGAEFQSSARGRLDG
jgi:protein arginine N-methyltransferase 1